MGLVYVTGISGSGKSAVLRELTERGYEAHGSDEERLSQWYRRDDNSLVENPPELEERTKEWYDQHDWRMRREDVEALSRKAAGGIIFLCGVTSNQEDMYDLFEKIILLTVDRDTMVGRIKNREDNDFGKQPHELENILLWHEESEKITQQLGGIPVDANQPLDHVVDQVITIAEQK